MAKKPNKALTDIDQIQDHLLERLDKLMDRLDKIHDTLARQEEALAEHLRDNDLSSFNYEELH